MPCRDAWVKIPVNSLGKCLLGVDPKLVSEGRTFSEYCGTGEEGVYVGGVDMLAVHLKYPGNI